jgi:transcriptional regulator with XRE-family HTH domain
MNHLRRLGQRVAQIRRIKKITQEELAERSGLTLSYISKIETGRRNPTITVVSKIAQSLDVDIYQLFTTLELELMNDRAILDKWRKW